MVAVCDAASVEMWAVAEVEDESSCACKVCMGRVMLVHHVASIWTCKRTIRSMQMRAGVPANSEITTKDVQLVADPHFSRRYSACPAIGKGLPLAHLITRW